MTLFISHIKISIPQNLKPKVHEGLTIAPANESAWL